MPSDNSIDPRLLAAGNASLVDEKMRRVLESSEAKKAALNAQIKASFRRDPLEVVSAEEINTASAALREKEARLTDDFYGRTASEFLGDTGRNIAGTTATMGTGLVALGLETMRSRDPSRLLGPEQESAYSKGLRDAAQGVSDVGSRIQQRLQEQNSGTARRRVADAAANQARDEAAHAAEAAAAGGGKWEQAKAFVKDIGSSIKNVSSNPGHLLDTVIAQLPTLAGGLAVRGGMSAEAIAARATEIAAKRGAGTAVTREIMEEAIHDLGKVPFMATTGLLEGGGAYSEAVGTVMNTQLDQLVQQYPEAAAMLEAGVSEDEIRARIADDVSSKAAALQGVAAAGLGRLASRFELNPAGQIGQLGANIMREGVEEGLQGATGALSQNIAQITSGNEETGILDNVADSTGQSMVAGMGMPVLTQGTAAAAQATLLAPVAAVNAVVQGAKFIAPGVSKAVKAAGSAAGAAVEVVGAMAKPRADKVRAEADNTRKEAEREELATNTAELQTTLEQAGGKLDLSEAVNQLTPEQASAVQAEGTDHLELFNQVVQQLADGDTDGKPLSGERLNASLSYLVSAKASLQALSRSAQSQLDQLGDDAPAEQRSALQVLKRQADTLLSNPVVSFVSQNEGIAKLTQEQLEAYREASAQVGADANLSTLPPETQKAASYLRSMISMGQTQGMNAQDIQQVRVLYSEDLDANEQALFTAAEQSASAREAHDAIAGARKKSMQTVGTEIRSAGFQLNGKALNSLSDFAYEIQGLLGAGQVKSAQGALTRLGEWAKYATARSNKFDELANTQLENGKTGNWEKLDLPYNQLKLDNQSLDVYSRQYVDLRNSGGQELGIAIQEDAQAIVDQFNALRQALPEKLRPAALNAIPAHTWPAIASKTKIPAPTKATESTAAPTASATSAAPEKETAASERPAPAAPQATAEVPKTEAQPAVSAEQPRVEEDAVEEPTLTPTLAVDFGTAPSEVAEQELGDALTLSNKDYLARVGGDKATSTSEAKGMVQELLADEDGEYPDIPSRATVVRELDNGITLFADGNFLYAGDADGRRVGQLAHSDAGTEFAVHPGYQGRGIGQAMMRELLIRKPFAAAGSMTKSARATRTAVLKQLRQERTRPTFDSMESRFPGLITSLKAAGKFAGNRFLSAFKLNPKSTSLFATQANPLEALKTAIDAGPEAVRALLADPDALGQISPEHMTALQAIVGQIYPALAGAINAQMQTLGAKETKRLQDSLGHESKSPAGKLIDTLMGARTKAQVLWNAADKQALHMMVPTSRGGELSFALQQQILDGTVMATLRWAIEVINTPTRFDEERVSKSYPDQVVPPEYVEFYEKFHSNIAVLPNLMQAITQTLGLSVNRESSGTNIDGIPKTLALTALQALADTKLNNKFPFLTVHQVTPAMAYKDEEAGWQQQPDSPVRTRALENIAARRAKLEKRMYFLEFPGMEESTGVLTRMSQLLGHTTTLLDNLLGIDYTRLARVGSPGRPNLVVKGTNVAAGEGQAAALRNLSQTAHTINLVLQEKLESLTAEQRHALYGEVDTDESRISLADLPRRRSLMLAARRTDREINKLVERARAYAKVAQVDFDTVQLFWNYRMNSNGRAEQEGFGGQANKWARELFITEMAEVNLADESSLRDYWLSLAQALDVKVEQKDAAASRAEIQKALAEKHAGLLDMTANADDSQALVDGVIAAGFGNRARAFHALLTHARFLNAQANGDATFKHGLVFEIDGKTDGPINALMQFGLSHLSPTLLKQLAQGGLFLGRKGQDTLNQNPDQKDLYSNRLTQFGEQMRKYLRELRTKDNDIADLVQNTLKGLQRIKRVEGVMVDGELQYNALRNMFKNPLTQKVYGAGDPAIIVAAAKELASHYGQLISQAVADNRILTPEELKEIHDALGFFIHKGKEKDAPLRKFSEDMFPLRTMEDLRNFRITPGNIRALTSQLQHGAGHVLAAQANLELAAPIATMNHLFKVTAMQAMAYATAVRQAYQERRLELIKDGVLSDQDALSPVEQEKLLERFRHLEPVFHTSQTTGGHGITLVNGREKAPLELVAGNGRHTYNDAVEVTSAAGKLSQPVRTSLPSSDVGVRIAALLNIAAGDGAMMGQVFAEVRSWFNVFDGLEVPGGQLDQASRVVNEAVWNNWNQDVLGTVVEQFERFKFEFDRLSTEELQVLVKRMRDETGESLLLETPNDRGALLKYLQDTHKTSMAALQKTHEVTLAVKQAMNEVQSSTDHMAGPEAPFRREGLVFGSDEETYNYLVKRASELLGETPLTFAAELAIEQDVADTIRQNAILAGEVVEAEAPDTTEVATALSVPGEDVVTAGARRLSGREIKQLLDKHAFKNKVTGLVYGKLRHLLPDDLQIFVGTSEELRAEAERLFPEIDWSNTRPGAFFRNTIFHKVTAKGGFSEKTMVHELVHAATLHLIQDYYQNGGRKLTRTQKEVIRGLELLGRHAIAMRTDDMPAQLVPRFKKFQQVLQSRLEAGFIGDMVEELMAHTLTDKSLQAALKYKSAPTGLRALGVRIQQALRRLFNLPENTAVDNFLGQVIGHTASLVARAKLPDTLVEQRVLFDELEEDDVSTEHRAHLQDLVQRMEDLIQTLPGDADPEAIVAGLEIKRVPYTQQEARLYGTTQLRMLQDADFMLSSEEAAGFLQVHAVITALSMLDPLAISEMQDLHQQASKILDYPDLAFGMDLASGDAVDVAQKRYNALRFPPGQDAYGRSPMLANFIALAAVHEPFRQVLAGHRMTVKQVDRGSMDSMLRTVTQKGFDVLGEKALKTLNKSQTQVVDEMLLRIANAQRHAASTKPSKLVGTIDKAETAVKNRFHQVGAYAQGVADRASEARQEQQTLRNGVTQLGAQLLAALLAPESEGELNAQTLTRMMNTTTGMPNWMRKLGNEVMGTNDGNRQVHRMLSEGKTRVSQIRQRLREQVPAMIRDRFSKRIGKAQQTLMHKTLARTDVSALLGQYDLPAIAKLLRDGAYRQTEIVRLRQLLPANALGDRIDAKSKALGQYLVTRSTVNSDRFLARNATAVQRLAEIETNLTMPESQVESIDALITLYALDTLSEAERVNTAELVEQESAGVQDVLRVLQQLKKLELSKSDDPALHLNTWKGYIPTSRDPRKDLVLASAAYGVDLEKRGYRRVGIYQNDNAELSSARYYYASQWSGGASTYNQGAIQTAEKSLMGIDVLTGQTLDPAAATIISGEDVVENIVSAKVAEMRRTGQPEGQGPQLLPILDAAGMVVAFERPLDAGLLQAHLVQHGRLDDAIGMWFGRQAEESLAGSLNERIVELMGSQWEADVAAGRADEYERVDNASDRVLRDSWDALPRHTQEALHERFRALGAPGVMVRKDLADNTLGYRAASVSDIFTGTSNLKPEVRQALENIAFALAGKRAYPLLVTGERAWQGLIGTAKDMIVVRTGVVAVANLLANQVQLLQMTGWNPARLLRTQAAKAKELEHFLRNQHRLSEIVIELATTVDSQKRSELEAERVALQDANSRLSIKPLLDYGMLPTIAEGLSEQDQYTLLHDGMRWVEQKAEKLPKGVLTAAKYAMVSKDTALYQGLNRMIQFGDFMAKATLFDALMEKGKVQANTEASMKVLDEVDESFVNYNLLPGRGRDYLEQMGVTWFWNYKLRIQKIALREFKRHPLRFLAMGAGADWLGQDSLMSSSAPLANYSYSIGLDQMSRAHETLLWRMVNQ